MATEVGLPTSFGDITKLIRVKEKELHEIHDRRCAQLESLVVERDNLLLESASKFEQLKDDFQYNLVLLEARDKEIERLESCLKSSAHNLDLSEAEIRQLHARVEAYERKEAEQLQKQAESKAANKVTHKVLCCLSLKRNLR
jgi:urease accessory protein UreH